MTERIEDQSDVMTSNEMITALTPIAEEPPPTSFKKTSSLRKFFTGRTKKIVRSVTIEKALPSLGQPSFPEKKRQLSFDLESDNMANTSTSSSAASTCSDRSYARTISSDAGGLHELTRNARAFSCSSMNNDQSGSDGDRQLDRGDLSADAQCPVRISIDQSEVADNEQEEEDEVSLKRDGRNRSKLAYFTPNGDRNLFKKMFQPSFHQRSAQFRKLFSDHVPLDEGLLASFSCAYQREILVQGRIFISTRHFCFYANILGWGTIFVIPITEVVDITKEKAAFIFPNSIQLTCDNGNRFFFASFSNREKSYKVMRMVWESVTNGDPITAEELWERMNPVVEPRPEKVSKRGKSGGSVSSSDAAPMHKNHSAPVLDHSECGSGSSEGGGADGANDRTSTSSMDDVLVHSPAYPEDCPCSKHVGKKLIDQVFPRTPEQLYDLLFTNNPWFFKIGKWLNTTAHRDLPKKYLGYVASDWATDKDGVRQRTCTYTMLLTQAMAPKSCVVTEKQVYTGIPYGFIVNKESHNAGIPYSDSFVVSCTYCVTACGDGESRLVVHGGLVYRKSVWGLIKSFIEKSTEQGLDEHYTSLRHALTVECERVAAGGENAEMEENGRMDTSSEEGVEGDDVNTARGMVGSVSGINFLHQQHPGQHESTINLPYLGVVRRIDFYGMTAITLLSFIALLMFVLVMRTPRTIVAPPPSESRIEQLFDRYMTPDDAAQPPASDLDSLIAAVARIGEQLQRVRDASSSASPRPTEL